MHNFYYFIYLDGDYKIVYIYFAMIVLFFIPVPPLPRPRPLLFPRRVSQPPAFSALLQRISRGTQSAKWRLQLIRRQLGPGSARNVLFFSCRQGSCQGRSELRVARLGLHPDFQHKPRDKEPPA